MLSGALSNSENEPLGQTIIILGNRFAGRAASAFFSCSFSFATTALQRARNSPYTGNGVERRLGSLPVNTTPPPKNSSTTTGQARPQSSRRPGMGLASLRSNFFFSLWIASSSGCKLASSTIRHLLRPVPKLSRCFLLRSLVNATERTIP